MVFGIVVAILDVTVCVIIVVMVVLVAMLDVCSHGQHGITCKDRIELSVEERLHGM